MKKFTSVILTIALICSLSACGMNNTADNTSSAQTSAIETAGSEVSVETSTETVDTDVFEKDGSDVVIDTENSNVEISETSDGTKVATVKTDDGKEVKVAVKEDESGKTVVDTSKVVDDNGNVEKSDGKTEVKVDEGGNVTITKETSKPVEKSEVSQTSKPSSTSKTESSKPSQTSKPSESSKVNETSKVNDTSKPAETSKPTETSKPVETSKPTESSKPSEPSKPSTVEVTSITLNKTNVTLGEGKTTTLTATVNPSNANNKTITWSSDNTSIATVNNGTVTAKKAGTANIIAKSNNGKTATCKVTITHEHNWVAQTKTVHHDATYKYKDVYENVETKIWWDGVCANDWEFDQNGNWKDLNPHSPTYGQIVSPDVKPGYYDLYWADGRNELHTVCKSLTPMGETTPWYMILEYLGYCTLDDILDCKYDWVIKRNTSDWYDDGIYYAIDCDKLFKQEHRAYTACGEYCGSTTNSNANPIYIKSIYEYKKTGQKKVIDTPAYDETVITGYKCSCGATK